MSAVQTAMETPQPVPRLLVDLPSRREVFFGNLRDLFRSRPEAPLELRSAPAPFWPDVFIQHSLPWNRFIQSVAYHLVALGLLLGLTHLLSLQPRVVRQFAFNHSEVVYYQPSEYLPALDTRRTRSERPRKAEPQLSRQPIISVPREADNREQTIVTPPRVMVKRSVAVPNMVAWSDEQKPRLAIPAPPLTPASEISRVTPKLDDSVVTPPPDATHVADRRHSLQLQSSVVAPPPDVRDQKSGGFQGLQPALIAPPPTVETASNRPLGDMNIASSTVIAPAPRLPMAAQRARSYAGANSPGSPQIVPPPPALAASGSSGASFGSRGHVIALSLHPAVGAPPVTPAGNRRGAFASTPEGHPGASGLPGSASKASTNRTGSGDGSKRRGSSDLPAGLYVGSTSAKPSVIAGEPGSKSADRLANPNLIASVPQPRVRTAPHAVQPGNAAKLSEAERTVFGGRKFYSVTLNMPNLNSAGGSWVIRFAELNHDSGPHDATAPAPDLTEPMARRKVDPAYPMQLMRENVAGTVILYAIIRADGSVGDVRVLRGVDDRLDRFAEEAVSQWKFEPATKNGSPVDVEATFQIPFRPSRLGSTF